MSQQVLWAKPGRIFIGGSFQAVLKSKADVDMVLRGNVRIQGTPVHVYRWSIQGCSQIGRSDIALYWIRLPGLPVHCLTSLDVIGAKIGIYLATRPSHQEVLTGVPPEICVQISDSEPSQMKSLSTGTRVEARELPSAKGRVQRFGSKL